MVDNRSEDTGSLPDAGRPKREPPTIDLEAVSSETRAAGETSSDPAAEPAPKVAANETSPEIAEAPAEETPRAAEPPSRPVSPWVVAPVSGAVAAALVIGVGWMLGWPAIQPVNVPPAAQQNAAAIDGLAARVASLEAKAGKLVADPRTDALEKSVVTLRAELAAARAQGEKLASALNDVKSAPRADGAVSPDLTAFAERMAKIENQMRAQGAEIAQQGSKIANAQSADAKAANDMPWRRVLAAVLLDVLVRVGDPYPAALATAKSLAPSPDALKPLDPFAEKGVPNANRLSSELLALVPKLTPAQQAAATTGTGIVDRLQAGAARLVKIERTDTAGTDRGAVVARITAAALRNDFNEARRELKTLSPEDRAAAQGWLDRADARDAALAAARQFATEAMAVLAKPSE